ncbi:MAG TPA: hypothetical protein VFC78_22865 [Tepidisphaeraceae bacterium]|nr:hypothetical protein [Tepidisphaeraceae bacterium]
MAESPNGFKILGPVSRVEVIAGGRGVKIIDFLRDTYGGSRWRKLKGIALIEDDYGWTGNAEIHWFEAHGVGRVRWKIKRKLDGQ